MPVYTDIFVKERFNKKEHWIRENLICEVIMGSQAYGCQTDESDTDIVGVVMNKHEHLFPQAYDYILGFDDIPNFKHKSINGPQGRVVMENGKDLEGSWHSLTDFFFLAAKKGSPNMVELLFTNRNLITFAHPVFWMLKDNRKLFLSMKSFNAFKGYCFQQISRAKRGQKRWEETGECDNSKRKVYYEKYGMDVKQNYHPLRLLDMCDQLIKIGDIDLQRNKEECKSMRRGEWGDSFDDFEKYVMEKLHGLESWCDNNTPAIPHIPQAEPLHVLLGECIEEWYGSFDKGQKGSSEFVSAKDVMEKLNAIEAMVKPKPKKKPINLGGRKDGSMLG